MHTYPPQCARTNSYGQVNWSNVEWTKWPNTHNDKKTSWTQNTSTDCSTRQLLRHRVPYLHTYIFQNTCWFKLSNRSKLHDNWHTCLLTYHWAEEEWYHEYRRPRPTEITANNDNDQWLDMYWWITHYAMKCILLTVQFSMYFDIL